MRADNIIFGCSVEQMIRLVELSKSKEAHDHAELAECLRRFAPHSEDSLIQAVENFIASTYFEEKPRNDWPQLLEEFAERHLSLLRHVRELDRGQSEIGNLQRQATEAVEAGNYDAAATALAEISNIQKREFIRAHQEKFDRTRSYIRNQIILGDVYEAKFDYLSAVSCYDEATKYEGSVDNNLYYQDKAANLTVKYGESRNDGNYILGAIRRYRIITEHKYIMFYKYIAFEAYLKIGNCFSRLCEMKSEIKYGEDAITYYDKAYDLGKDFISPESHANIKANTGNTYRFISNLLGEEGTEYINKALDKYEEALSFVEEFSFIWAMTNLNIGNCFAESFDLNNIFEAIKYYHLALDERCNVRNIDPLAWAMIQRNLGNVYYMLGGRETDTEHLKLAEIAYAESLTVYKEDVDPYLHKVISEALSNIKGEILRKGL